MKKTFVHAGLLCTMILLFATCSKVDWHFLKQQGKKDCDVQSYTLSFPWQPSATTLFKKKYNASGDRISEIGFTFVSVGLPFTPYKARLAYHGLAIYLINVDNAQDTTMKIYLNAKGRVKECFGKFRVNYTKFYYDANNRLSSFDFDWGIAIRNVCEYDQFGNILRIVRDGPGSDRFGSYYVYDYSRKAKRQFYRDAPSENDDFTLLHYLGFFPELEPVHVRTYTWMGTETEAYWYKQHITNHKFDSKGRLFQYDLVYYTEDSTYLNFQAFATWNCK